MNDEDDQSVPTSLPLARSEKDNRAPFRIVPNEPFLIELGRGSGQQGLETIRIAEDGTVVVNRQKAATWETGTLLLNRDALGKAIGLIYSNRLFELDKAYHANVQDGTQWVIWIKQGASEKSVYFNNYFPSEVKQFAKQLDELLAENGFGKVTWKTIPATESRSHEKELWDSLK